jgi:LacI family transcriptional regulator
MTSPAKKNLMQISTKNKSDTTSDHKNKFHLYERKVTLKQIAKELDVSISTVSKSLRNSLEIGEDTRLKVQAFAKFYNYRPNNIALSLRTEKTKP